MRYLRRVATSPLLSPDLDRVRRALDELDGGTLLPALGEQLRCALEGSDVAAREYVRWFQVLERRILDDVCSARPDIISRTDEGEFAIVDVKGIPRRAPVEALETISAEAPFGVWTSRFELEEAVALELTNRVRQLIGVQSIRLTPADARLGIGIDDAVARRFLRRVRFHLNHPHDEHPLRRLMEAFQLSKTELGRLFGVRRQAIDQWLERGIPAERQEKSQALLALVDLLQRKLKPGRLPGIARHPAEAYGGRTMLELITEDRHRELLEQVRESFDWASAA